MAFLSRVASLTAVSFLSLGATAAMAQEALLFDGTSGADVIASGDVADATAVAVDLALLAEAPAAVSFVLPDGRTLVAEQSDLDVRTLWNYAWSGELTDGTGEVDFTVYDGELSGSIRTGNEIYRIAPSAGEGYRLELLAAQPVGCSVGESEVANVPAGVLSGATVEVAPDPADSVDVMFVYTESARTSAGSHAKIRSRLQGSIDLANRALRNSNANLKLNFVHSFEVGRRSDGDPRKDLDWVTENANVATQRDKHAADIVVMVTERMDNACGLGWVQKTVGAYFERYAFSVAALGCLNGHTVAHEIGHNLGLEHDYANGEQDRDAASFPWSYGRAHNGLYRTVMAYGNTCANGCPTASYFSNPDVVYMEKKTGVVDRADSARTIRQTRAGAANFRLSGGGGSDGPRLVASSRIRGIGGGWIGEAGVLSTNQLAESQWHALEFGTTYSGAVVVLGPVSRNGGDPSTARLQSVSGNGFQFQIDEWDYLDQRHTRETVSYLALRSGARTFDNGTRVQSGTTSATHEWVRVNLKDGHFRQRPLILATSQTMRGSDSVVVRVRNVTETGFEMRLQEQESFGSHTQENVGWIAVEPGAGGGATPFATAERSATDTGAWFSYGGEFGEAAVLAGMQTYNGADTAVLRWTAGEKGRSQLVIEEERSKDSEMRHTSERIGMVAFDVSMNAGADEARTDVGASRHVVAAADQDNPPAELASESTPDDFIDSTVTSPTVVQATGAACSTSPAAVPGTSVGWLAMLGLLGARIRIRRRK